MQFKNIHIQNFRGFKELKIEDFKQVNLFVGKNNAGKSSVLEALFLTIGISNPTLAQNIHILRGGIIEENAHHFQLLFFGFNSKNNIYIHVDTFEKDVYRELIIKPLFQQISFTSKEKNENLDISITNSKSSIKVVNGIEYDFKIKKRHQQAKTYQASIQGVTKLNLTSNYEETIGATIYLPSQVTNWADIASKLNTILVDKEEESLIIPLQGIDERIKTISIGANNFIYCDLGFDKLVPIHILGDGIKHFLSILVDIYFCKGGIFLIDEIDSGLHYSVLVKLWKAIFKASQEYDVQLFATTHSDECVRAYSQAHQEIYGIEDDNIRLYRIERNEDDTHKAIKLEAENLSGILEMNWEYR